MIAYLNQNQGFVLSVLTFVYVVATVVLVVIGTRQTNAAYRSLEFARECEQRRNRPVILFDVRSDFPFYHAEIKNIGASQAINVSVILDEACKSGLMEQTGFLETGLSLVGPNCLFSVPIADEEELSAEKHNHCFSGQIHYADIYGQSYSENFHIDLSYVLKMTYTETSGISKDAKAIVDAIKVNRGERVI